jgi:hypothetical protein
LDFADILVEEEGTLLLPVNTSLVGHLVQIYGKLSSEDNFRIGPNGRLELFGVGGFDDYHIGEYRFDDVLLYGNGILDLHDVVSLNVSSFSMERGSRVQSENRHALGVSVFSEDRFYMENGSKWDALGGGYEESFDGEIDGCSINTLAGSGGTYGGQGGYAGNSPCGSFDDPLHLGMPGGSVSGNGSRGGGSVFIRGVDVSTSAQEIILDGLIDVSGSDGNVWSESGGGSGGSILAFGNCR